MNTVGLHFTKITPLCLIFCALGCFALSPQTQAVNPPLTPDPGSKPVSNTADGQNALLSVTTGIHNSAFGFDALLSNTDANFNTAVGSAALLSNDGTENTAVGCGALLSNTSGANNTANGAFALFFNTIGEGNTAVGMAALENNTDTFNTATGFQALMLNSGGGANTATGAFALLNNNDGSGNSAFGRDALNTNADGFDNSAFGIAALSNNFDGSNNTAMGTASLASNTSGSNNIGLGDGAGQNLTTGDNNIDIGNDGVADEAGTIRIGAQGTHTQTFVAGISGVTVTGDPVVVSSDGQLGVATSSQRFKDEIKPMNKASEAILALKPVTFRYKKEIDPHRAQQFGLVAEQVEKVNPDLVARDKEGKPYTVRYDAVNAMLLNEFLKEHRKVQELEANSEHQQRQIEALTAGLQKVSVQLETNKPAVQLVEDNQER